MRRTHVPMITDDEPATSFFDAPLSASRGASVDMSSSALGGANDQDRQRERSERPESERSDDEHAFVTELLADRLSRMGESKEASRVFRCAAEARRRTAWLAGDRSGPSPSVESKERFRKWLAGGKQGPKPFGDRCGSHFCGMCAARSAKRNRAGVEAMLRALPDDAQLVSFTLTVGVDSIDQGRRLLRGLFPKLRRQVCFAGVQWGRGQIEVEPSRGMGGPRFNVHQHLVMGLVAGGKIRAGKVTGAWRELLEGVPGHVIIKPVVSRFADPARTFLGAGLLLHRPRSLRVAGVVGRGLRGAGARASARARTERQDAPPRLGNLVREAA